MQRAIFVQYRHFVGGEQFGRHGFHGDLLSILPELCLRIQQRLFWVLVHLAQLDNALHLDRVFRDEFAVGHEVVAVDAHADAERGLLGVGVIVSCDVGREVLKQLGFVAARGFRKRADDGLHLIRREGGYVHILRFEVFCHHGRDAVRRECRGQRAARDLLIRQHKSGQTIRGQTAGIHIVLFQII